MKNLTKTGENFIRTICSGTSTSLIIGQTTDKASGFYDYNLPFSTIEFTPTNFNANAYDHNGDLITSNTKLGEALIVWFNFYAKLNNLDANILAAQAYEISKYRLWHYSKDGNSSLNGFIPLRVYRHIVKGNQPDTVEGMLTLDAQYTNNEISKITLGITNFDIKESYIYRGIEVTTESTQIAINNRLQLHKNMMNNPAIMIKAQSNLFKEIAKRNNGIVANTLFAYNRNYKLAGTSYNDILLNSGRKNDSIYVKDGVDYVERIFGYLGDKNNIYISKLEKPKGISFGYDIDFTKDTFNSFLG